MSARKRRLLVLDDDPEVVSYLTEELEREAFAVTGATDPADALARIERDNFDLVISDIEMPGMRGTDLLAAIQSRRPDQLVVLITAFGSIDLAVRSIHAGAADFVAKPFRIEALLLVVERALRERQMRHEIVRLRRRLAEDPDPTVVAVSPAMRRAVDLARRAAGTDATVLLTGESGTGKGELARIIHESGPRRNGAFVRLNAAALPATLVESELFGVKRGAFTDAKEDRKGLFVAASAGTLFLDEVGELAPETQAKLLHVLESGRVRPVGSVEELDAHARVVAATNRPLETLMAEGRFRADLYYRINVIRIDVPPLRDRREDILPLIDGLLGRACERLGRPVAGISKDAMRLLMAHDWPGNVRELANTLERAVALSDHDTIVAEDLAGIGARPAAATVISPALGLTLAELSRDYARRVLDAHEGNKAAAARALDIDRRTLYRMLGNGEGDEAETG
ncbi:MAG TPA: sigma-54 dependent transcriptional regulator [Candidatus Polarisedimenticolaceae bacterium]|nr:sigma-54 dependent transcriptional regulator [Candidatus Polarisedimenticolaceae bacterium]